MAVDIKEMSRRILEEVYGRGEVDVLDEVCDPSFRSHDPLAGDSDAAGVKQQARMYRTAFPDLKPELLGACAEGDTACTRWRMSGTHRKALMGIEPTGKRITVEGISFDRFRNGKLVESFTQWDTLHFLRALGAIPEARPAGPTAAEPRPDAY